MGSAAVDAGAEHGLRFYQAPVGKKAVMAVTGAILAVYVVAHMLGNLQIFLGRAQINGYAVFLHSHTVLLWIARIILLAGVIVHVITAVLLWLQNRAARPVGYVRSRRVPPGYASRTMYWTGPLLALYVIYHVMHLTLGDAGLPFRELDAFDNMVGGFSLPAVSAVYIAAMVVLGMHLYHGIWSMFQDFGVSNPRYSMLLKRFSKGIAIIVAAGFVSIPVAVLVGLVHG